jgi:hypothetical protein
MVWWVVEALRASQRIDRVALIGAPVCRELAPNTDVFVTEREDETANIVAGIEALPDAEHILMSSADTPLLTQEALQDFFDNAPDCDVAYPIVERADVEREFPNRTWVYVKAKEGHYTGASCFLFRRQSVLDKREYLRRVLDARRSVWRLVRIWGLGFAVSFLTHRLSISAAEKRLSEVLGLVGRAYISRYPEIALDVDHPADLALVRQRLARLADRPQG